MSDRPHFRVEDGVAGGYVLRRRRSGVGHRDAQN
jgi:hypothetical protein